MIKTFKATEEQSNKKIFQLQANYQILKEEKQSMSEGFDKRMNMLIRAFVKTFERLVENFKNYKEIASKEIECLAVVIEAKDKYIETKENEVNEYEMALRIPRMHYKHIEKLRFAEIMEQRDAIIQRIRRRYGIDPTKATALLKMPDPSLPPEQ